MSNASLFYFLIYYFSYLAALAQLVEHFTRNEKVRSSILRGGSRRTDFQMVYLYHMDRETTHDLDEQILELENKMIQVDFWNDKEQAQAVIKELRELKEKREGSKAYDRGGAIMTILSGAGGDDSEDFSRMLLEMYYKYAGKNGYEVSVLHQNQNDHGGYRNVTIEIQGNGVYGNLKNENGVHRLVRISPFNAKGLRHTSFSMVEVLPIIKDQKIEIRPEDIRVEFSRSGGPGGQNVNKRETAVRVVHIPTNIAVHVDTERQQDQNRQKALEILSAKLFAIEEEKQKAEIEGRQVSKTTEIEWGNQIRSYVLHPYKMVKDHRTDVETSNVEAVLEDGDIEMFVEAEKAL